MIDGLDDLVASIMEGPKRVRSMNTNSRGLVRAMMPLVEAAAPITGRGVGYKLFVAKKIRSMSASEMKKVYRLLKEAREQGMMPWRWIIDETRELERVPSWNNPVDSSNHRVARCGPKRARCEACCSQCSMHTAWAFELCTAMPAQPPSTMSLKFITTTAVR